MGVQPPGTGWLMVNLAGYDIVVEASLRTVQDLLNQVPVSMPAGDSVYLFGGPFPLNLTNQTVGGASANVRVKIEASLRGVAGTATAELVLQLSEGVISAGPATVNNIGGEVVATVTIIFQPVPGPPGQLPLLVPVVTFPVTGLTCQLDRVTQTRANQLLGPSGASTICAAITTGLEAVLTAIGPRQLPLQRVRLQAGRDSNDPTVVSAPPVASWITPDVLGLFALYRADGSHANAAAKRDPDINPDVPKYMFSQPGPIATLPAYQCSAHLSPEGFRLVLACPGARIVTAGLVRAAHRPPVATDVERTLRDPYTAQVTAELTTTAAEPGAPSLKDRVAAEVDKRLAAEVDRRLDALMASADGQAEVSASVPAPCGTGKVQVLRRPLPAPLDDNLIAYLDKFELTLGDGHLDLFAHASGQLSKCGRFTVARALPISLWVTAASIGPGMGDGQTDVDIDVNPLCQLAASLLGSLFLGPTGAFLATYVMLTGPDIAEKFAAYMIAAQPLPDIDSIQPDLSVSPLPTQFDKAIVDRSALTVTSLIRVSTNYNDQSPRVVVRHRVLAHTGSDVTESVTVTESASPLVAGCHGGTWVGQRGWYDTLVAVDLEVSNILLPLQSVTWTCDGGNFTRGIGDMIYPIPEWTHEPAELVAPQTTVRAQVFRPVPIPDGAFEDGHPVLTVTATGTAGPGASNVAGWQLAMEAGDGNFFLQVAARVVDANGTVHDAADIIQVAGDVVEWPQDYTDYLTECQRQLADYIKHDLQKHPPSLLMARVAPGAPVQAQQLAGVSWLLQRGDPKSVVQMQDLMHDTSMNPPEMVHQLSHFALNPQHMALTMFGTHTGLGLLAGPGTWHTSS